MKKTKKKEISIGVVKEMLSPADLGEVVCDFKTSGYFLSLLGAILFFFACLYFLIPQLLSTSKNGADFSNILCFLLLFIILVLPAVYFALKILNYKIILTKTDIMVSNMFGITRYYSLKNIKSASFRKGFSDADSVLAGNDVFVFKLNGGKRIRVASTCRNFQNFSRFVLFLAQNGVIRDFYM